jgi:N6-adenosine-specific RNA methylase IME4
MTPPRFSTILADPPWQYRKAPKSASTSAHTGRWVETGHYETLTMREMAELPVESVAEENAHLYLWITNPRLYGDRGDLSFNPAHLMEAWGFSYRTALTWRKLGAPGMGNYYRIDTEHLLFGVRGSCQVAPSERVRNVFEAVPQMFEAKKTRHSVKPDLAFDLIEQVSPGPYLELFARRARMGWECWGNQVDSTVDLCPEGSE